ncbi:dipeptide ABC transporter ATP-binding protein [Streptomyces marincola]|uniref:dipeptide ABC transporter ATP-binding protein n=1 Tax=Streptomyces marincola TaxID=2878388 RepID=UPI001CF17B80|nr:ABC transporter ATP-binding protein [Streptomyces marincola]UCM87069.1 ABC transporter ATP-binding protein [Streptomyces marincola]
MTGARPEPLVDVADLTVAFGDTTVVSGVSLSVGPGECLAVVGESGSGKSVTARSLIGLPGPGATVTATSLRIEGEDARAFGDRQWRAIRGARVGLVLQDALVSLDPLRPVGQEIAEALRLHRAVPRGREHERVVELLRLVGVPEPEQRAAQYPHQLSGGLRQRALIASAIGCEPPLLIADEPTTALDVTVQAQILRLLAERKQAGTGVLLISHDLAVVGQLADRIMVMRHGVAVETGEAARILTAPTHPYTRELLAAVPGTRATPPRAPVAPHRDRPVDGTGERPTPPPAVIEARGLVKTYGARRAVDDVSFTLREGEILGLVGESGSGKTTLARLALGQLTPDAGDIRVSGRAWTAMSGRERRTARTAAQMVYQDPLSSFDPRFSVWQVLKEALRAGGVPRAACPARAADLLVRVGLDPDLLPRRPLRLSGGQRQRVAIARALATKPRVIVCDEPVSALDVTVQAGILDLLARLRAESGVSMLFISHDLGVIREVSDRVMVLNGGRVVESGTTAQVFDQPRADYTRALLAAIPRLPTTADPSLTTAAEGRGT